MPNYSNGKRRVSRKVKKWHKKHGWETYFTSYGEAYFTRYAPIPFMQHHLVGGWQLEREKEKG